MEMASNGMVPVYEVNKGEGGMSTWMYFLFFFLLLVGFGGNGFGNGFGGGISNGANFVNNDFLYTNLKNTIDNGFTQVANQNFGIQKDLWQGFSGLQAGISNMGYQMQNCCCETNRNIDAVRYEAAQNTCAITTNDSANTQKILDKLCSMESNAKDQRIADLMTQLQAAQLQLGNLSQTQSIVNQVRPFPVPAYPVSSPYGTCGTGCNVTCGC